MSESNRSAVILAAVQAAGTNDGVEYTQRVIENAKQISVFLSEGSAVNKAIKQLEDSKKFTAEIVSVVKEKSSQRGFVELKTKPSQHHPDGKESARTERTDNPDGLAMAKRMRDLVGHRVLLWVEVEEYTNSNGSGKVRIIRHAEDLGAVESD